MPVLYEILSIAGWAALVVFLAYWSFFEARHRQKMIREPRGSNEPTPTPTDHHEKQL